MDRDVTTGKSSVRIARIILSGSEIRERPIPLEPAPLRRSMLLPEPHVPNPLRQERARQWLYWVYGYFLTMSIVQFLYRLNPYWANYKTWYPLGHRQVQSDQLFSKKNHFSRPSSPCANNGITRWRPSEPGWQNRKRLKNSHPNQIRNRVCATTPRK